MASRYDTGRRLGYRDEAVSSLDGRHRDAMASAAEDWVERILVGCRRIAGDKHRDPGYDIIHRGRTIDVKWTPWEPGGRGPTYPHLIVPTWKPRRADLYALVIGSSALRLDLYVWASGYATRQVVERAPVIEMGKVRKTSGKRAPVYAIGFDYLRPLEELNA